MLSEERVPGSFRDPSGFLYTRDGTLYRQVNEGYRAHFDHLMASGLYGRLVDTGLLVPHEEVGLDLARASPAYKVIRPQPVPFISYPYEWSFSQLKDAALTTLRIQQVALDHGMSLKDSSAYNIQFVDGRPLLVDTLSFELYQEGSPWVAYRQFCQHFLAPLALMSYRDVRLGRLLQAHIDGVPLDLAAGLLPARSRFNFALLLHVFLHARSQRRYADAEIDLERVRRSVSRQALLGLIDSLERGVRKLSWNPQTTAWADYYQDDSYDEAGLAHKRELVGAFLDEASPQTVWDLGANVGLFSRIASRRGIPTLSLDGDPGSVDLNYRQVVEDGDTSLLPLVVDLTNPSPGVGWENRERSSLLERGPADAALALALVHHLAISNNVPLDRVAAFLAGLCHWLIIEFVPKSDPKVKKLLATRDDIFPHYTQQGFEAAFDKLFSIKRSEKIRHSERVLFLMKLRSRQNSREKK